MALPDWTTVLALLQNTNFGKAWLSYTAFLVLAVFSKSLRLRVLALVGMLMALVFTSHAGEEGLLHATFWVDFVHLLLALSWLGGLTVLITLRLGKKHTIEVNGLQFFSKLALPVFILILASGVMQVILRILQENNLNFGYLAVLTTKLILVVVIMLSAWVLRRHLKQNKIDETVFDNGLSLEFFFALVLILTTGLLTQIPPS
jgi:putative copper resistance protein D